MIHLQRMVNSWSHGHFGRFMMFRERDIARGKIGRGAAPGQFDSGAHEAAVKYAALNRSDPTAYNRAVAAVKNGLFLPSEVSSGKVSL